MGYQTTLQKLIYAKDPTTGALSTVAKTDTDAFVFRHIFDRTTQYCVFCQDILAANMQRRITTFSGMAYIQSNGLVNITYNDADINKTRLTSNMQVPYASKYAGGFTLLDSYKIPRPCAFKSFNMTEADYYRGQWAMSYSIAQQNTVSYVTNLMTSPKLIGIDGNPSTVATYSNTTNSINIYTDSEDSVHVNQVILRDCNDLSRLLELNLYVRVLENTYPTPVTDIKTSFTLSVGDVLTYQIPKLVSPNGNDTPQVYVTVMQEKADMYPPFLMYENSTNTIILMPNSTQVQGRTYYFTIMVKNQHSDVISYPYMCTIKINGQIINIDNRINYTTINYTINWVDNYVGSIKFNKPVNMTWLQANFNNVFKYYWTDTDYTTNLKQNSFLDFEVTNWGAKDNMTVNFTMTFAKPYQIGLLHKKSDLLAFQLKKGYAGNEQYYCQLFIGNCTEINMSPNANAT